MRNAPVMQYSRGDVVYTFREEAFTPSRVTITGLPANEYRPKSKKKEPSTAKGNKKINKAAEIERKEREQMKPN